MTAAGRDELLLRSVFEPLGIGRSETDGSWLRGRLGYGASTASVWARVEATGAIDVCVSATLARALADAVADTLPLERADGGPSGAVLRGRVPDYVALHAALAQVAAAAEQTAPPPGATQLAARGQPDLLAQAAEAVDLAATETARMIQARVGQDAFRARLLAYWQGRCAITGLAVPDLLRASHSKPWSACTTANERLDVHNGFLLAAHLDAAFDQGFITVAPDSSVEISPTLGTADRACLGLTARLRVQRLEPAHEPYLAWHRAHLFRFNGA